MSDAQRIPAFVNPESGTAEGARDALSATGLFDIRETPPASLETEVRKAAESGARRILVSGGDGSIRSGAIALARTGIELAVLPAGTLNHFARDHGIPTDLKEAAVVATGSVVDDTDAGYVGDELFLNTSSIGAYVSFMRVRERLEPRLGYRIASFLALVRTFLYLRSATIELEIAGEKKTYSAQLLFIGVGERELQMPTLGNRKPGGKRGLHIIVVSGRAKSRLVALAFEAMTRGVKSAAKTPELDSFIVESCEVTMSRPWTTVALDGEAKKLAMPLKYRLEKDIIRIVRAEDTDT